MRQLALTRAGEVARYLRHPAGPPAMRHRQLDDAQPGPRRAHLHFQVPAVGHLAHAEAEQHVAADRAHRSHVGIAHAIKHTKRGADRVSGEQLMGVHAAPLAHSASPRADREIRATLGDRRDEKRDRFRAVAAVAVEKHEDLAIGRRLGAGPAGAPVAAASSLTTPAPAARARSTVPSLLPLSTTMTRSTAPLGIAAMTPAIASCSSRVGMTAATLGRDIGITGSSADRSRRKRRAGSRSAAPRETPDSARRSRFPAASALSRRRA